MSSSHSSIEAGTKKRSGVPILKEILKKIKLDENLIKENNCILKNFLNSFIAQMKSKDELFKFLYQEPYYTGSFYSDLRISQPDEFDINLILKLPFNESNLEVLHQFQTPSFVKYRLKNHEEELKKHPRLVSTLFENGFLIPGNLRQWLQSVVDKAARDYTAYRITVKQSGPARTILLHKSKGQIDIDLVPVISCTLELPKVSFDGRVSMKVGNKLMTFLVPKPYSPVGGRQIPINQAEMRCLWRSHFPKAEEQVIHNLGCVKPIIKLLKLLRDLEGWKSLASYYLKTVVMWIIIDHPSSDYWKEGKMDLRFVEALQRLSECVSRRRIQYLFSKKHNLIEKMGEQEASNISHRLNYFLRRIQETPHHLWAIFRMEPCFTNNSAGSTVNRLCLT